MSDSIIRTTAALNSVCEKARSCGVIALDTEFVWIRTYRPQLGIVQIAAGDECWALDCLTGVDTTALRAVIEDASVVKVLHDARQDMTLLRRYTGATPRNVFDTQLAAAFSGFRSGIGLQTLLFEACGIGLPKTETCTDWTQRPLTEAQIDYALDDVRYLDRLRGVLVDKARELGTLAWLEEELLKYDDSELYVDYDPERVWQRIKLFRTRLDGRGFAVLRAVAICREENARKWNLPRNWLGDDASLVDMAVAKRVQRLHHRVNGGQAETIKSMYASAIKEAIEIPEEELPDDPHRRYIREVLDSADDALAWLDERAAEINVDSGLIASRAVVTAYVDDVNDDTNPLACGWRYETVGREMAERFGVE